MEERKILVEDLLFILQPDEHVSILYPVEKEVLDEPFEGSYMLHHIFGPCYVYEGPALDMYVTLPKMLNGAEVANLESVITRDKDNHVVPATRIILKEQDRKTYREEQI